MGYFTIAGVFAIWVYPVMVIMPVCFAAYGFYEDGWRGMVKLAFEYNCLQTLKDLSGLAPEIIPLILSCKYPLGSPGMKVLLSVAALQHTPSQLYRVLSACTRYTLGAYLEDWIISTSSTCFVIGYLVTATYAFDIGWPEIDFIANIQVWETLKATPRFLLRLLWLYIKLPISLWYTPWWNPNAGKASVQDEEMAETSTDEKGDLAKHVVEDPAALAEQDKYLQEKIMEDSEA